MGINANTIQLVLEVDDRGSAKVTKFSSNLTDQVRRMSTGSSNHVRDLAASFQNKLGGSIERVKNSVLSLKALALTAFVGWGVERLAGSFIETGASMDKMKLSLDTITKGEGEAWFRRLNDWAMTMPINTEKAIQSFIMMRAMGLKPSIADMTTLVDTTSALGGQSDTLEGIARALGQIQSKGKGSAEELMQLAERGVPVFEILQQRLGLTGAQIQDIGNQTVSAGTIIKAIMDGLAERFGGQSDKIQKKYVGLIEAIKGYWTEFQRSVMDSGVMKVLEAGMTNFTSRLDAMIKDGSFQAWAEDVASRVVASFKKITMAAAGVYDWFAEYVPKISEYLSGLWGAFTSLPEWVRNGGLIGAFIYGKTGAVALTAAMHLLGAVKNSAAGMGLVASGQLKFGDFASMDRKALADYLADFNKENPQVDVSEKINMPVASFDSATAKMQMFWEGLEGTIAKAKSAAAGATGSIINDAETGLRNVQSAAAVSVKAQADAAIKIAQADVKSLNERLRQYEQYYDSLKGMMEKNKEQEKKHIEELNALYRQQASLAQSTAAQVRGLQEIGMSPGQKYQSQKSALDDQYISALKLSGQEQIKALEEYKQGLVSFGQTWGQGVTETTQNIIFGTQTNTIQAGKNIIDSVISDIEAATNIQRQALEGLSAEKQRQIEADRAWGDVLKQSAEEAVTSIQSLQGVIAELESQIANMQKVVTITGDDQVTWVVNDISIALAGLHDKVVHITTIYDSIGGPGDAAGGYGPGLNLSELDLNAPWSPTSYATGTPYVPRTGFYRLHQGEIVIPEEESRQIRQRAVLRGAAGSLGTDDYETVGDNGGSIVATDGVSPVVAAIIRSMSLLGDKTISISTVMHSIGGSPEAAVPAQTAAASGSSAPIASYATGTPYVPRTGFYRLHQGEIVIPEEESRQIRQRAVLRGAAGSLGTDDYETVGDNGGSIVATDGVSPVVAAIIRSMSLLGDKTISISTVMHSIGGSPEAAVPAQTAAASGSSAPIASYATGTPYVPRTGFYRLHQGEIVIPEEESRQIRQRAVLRGAAGSLGGDDYYETAGDGGIDTPAESSGGRSVERYREMVRSSAYLPMTPAPVATPAPRASESRTVQIGDIHIHIPESAAPQRPEDWRYIVRTFVKPELEKIGHA